MKLITETQMKKLIANHQNQDGSKSFKAVVKLFNPTGIGTWYLSELDLKTNIAYGLCCIHEAEYGYVSLDELANTPVGMGLGIERDIMFPSGYSLKDCMSFYENN